MSFSICGRSPSWTTCDATFAPRRCMSEALAADRAHLHLLALRLHFLYFPSARRRRLVFRAPHRPLSVVITTSDALHRVALDEEGVPVLGVGVADVRSDVADLLAVGARLPHALLRFRILEAATISIALVIFRVFCTLRIFILISLCLASLSLMSSPGASGGPVSSASLDSASAGMTEILERATFLPVFDGAFSASRPRGQVFLVFHGFYQRGELAFMWSRSDLSAASAFFTSIESK